MRAGSSARVSANQGVPQVKKVLAALTAATLMFGLGSVALAAGNGKAGPNGHNNGGLCTAYFNGQKKGWADGAPGPFAQLEQDAHDNDSTTNTEQEVLAFCGGATAIGGNPDNGRYPGCFDDPSANTAC